MKYGWINCNITDIWGKPEYNSERTNQILWGDAVEITSSKQSFYRIRKHDGYTGWVDQRMVTQMNRKDFISYKKKINYVVSSFDATLYDATARRTTAPFKLFYGTKIMVLKTVKNYKMVQMPDGETRFISSRHLSKLSNKNSVKALDFCNELKKFRGVPYLWGGITTSGVDCSGLVHSVLSRFGINFPRDTKDQIKIGVKIPKKLIIKGDLLFFDKHIAVALNSEKFIHSSKMNGGVNINSFNPKMINYRSNLDNDFKHARRLSCIK
jgi:hypothetical protein